MEFWTGILIGLFIGAGAGVLLAGLTSGGRRGRGEIEDSGASDFVDWVRDEQRRS